MRVLVIGGTGYLGGRIARGTTDACHEVVALVRPGSDAGALERLGARVVRGDLTDPGSLALALTGVEAVVTSAAGYTGRKPGDSLAAVDDRGNRNLVDAAAAAGVGRFVFVSVLTADAAVRVPHFHQKSLTEEYLGGSGVPFVALRPGGFLDQVLGWSAAELAGGTLPTVIPPDAPLTCILADDVARCAVAAVTAEGIVGERIDLGMDEPLTFRAVADGLARVLARPIALRYDPPAGPATSTAGAEGNPADDLAASIAWMGSGRYVADVAKQSRFFGPPPTLPDSLRRWVAAGAIGPVKEPAPRRR